MAKPILKWAGGKAALLPQIKPFLPDPSSYQNYIEPFLGGGAMFWEVGAKVSGYQILSDLNPELINLYRIVKYFPHELVVFLQDLERYYRELAPSGQKEYYLEVRDLEIQGELPRKAIASAARTVFLNKVGFNGLYRTNKSGKFNVPHGRPSGNKPVTICDAPAILEASKALQNAQIENADFRRLEGTGSESMDFIYLDPPYHPTSKSSNFTGYQPGGFSEQDQRDLARVFRHLSDRGDKVMLSNSDCEFTRSLYAGYRIESISRSGSISCKAGGRGRVGEILVLSY